MAFSFALFEPSQTIMPKLPERLHPHRYWHEPDLQ
jgi:hypothetical protein